LDRFASQTVLRRNTGFDIAILDYCSSKRNKEYIAIR